MTGPADSFQVGLAVETVFGTFVTPSRFFDSAKRPSWTAKAKNIYGSGMRPGQRVASRRKRLLVGWECAGDLEVDVTSVGMGAILKAFFGAATVTMIPATVAYQQVHTLATVPLDPISCTVQQTVERAGTTVAQTFLGAQCTQLDITAKSGEVVSMKSAWVARELDVSKPVATASYPATEETLTFIGGSIVVGTTLTAPTTTALATIAGGAPIGSVREISLTLKKGGKQRDAVLGDMRPRQVVVTAAATDLITGSAVIDYDTDALQTAYLAQTPTAMILNFAGVVEIATGVVPVLQIALPVALPDGALPAGADGDTATIKHEFTGLTPDAGGEPIYAVYRSLDTAV